jgi:hypothetical protein
MDTEMIPLPQLSAELRRLTGTLPVGGYGRAYKLALDGRLPTEMVNGRHYVRRENLPEVATLMGVKFRADRIAA